MRAKKKRKRMLQEQQAKDRDKSKEPNSKSNDFDDKSRDSEDKFDKSQDREKSETDEDTKDSTNAAVMDDESQGESESKVCIDSYLKVIDGHIIIYSIIYSISFSSIHGKQESVAFLGQSILSILKQKQHP